MRHVGDGAQMLFGIHGSVFAGLRYIDAAGEHHVLVVAVSVERCAELVEFRGVHQPVVVGERQHFVAGILDGAGLVHIRMTGFDGDHAGV